MCPGSNHDPSKNSTALEKVSDPVESAKSAGLRYVTDAKPGIRRQRRGRGFRYVMPGGPGASVRDMNTLARIRSLAIPPAWRNVWICPIANGHLQATGLDARGRKQNRYHPHWREVRDETKYERMMLFGLALPVIRERVEHHLGLPGLPRERVLATVVRLLETTFIRVGNEEYAHNNHSYGLTTMRNNHVEVEGATLHFRFRGKSGIRHEIDLNDRRLARIVRECRDLPGYELFQYLDENLETHSIDSADVNDYLREITNEHFTAKDFRTWAGSVLACAMLREFEPFESESEAKKNVVRAIESVAKQLGNTPSVCRKCYVHPAVIDSYIGGQMMKTLEKRVEKEIAHHPHGLREEEQALLRLLHKRLAA
jgi:DNA topoisomerase-1